MTDPEKKLLRGLAVEYIFDSPVAHQFVSSEFDRGIKMSTSRDRKTRLKGRMLVNNHLMIIMDENISNVKSSIKFLAYMNSIRSKIEDEHIDNAVRVTYEVIREELKAITKEK